MYNIYIHTLQYSTVHYTTLHYITLVFLYCHRFNECALILMFSSKDFGDEHPYLLLSVHQGSKEFDTHMIPCRKHIFNNNKHTVTILTKIG